MTFVIGSVTADYAVLVADRRLTWSDSGKVADDNRNKTIVLCGHFIMGYSGLAAIGGKPTDEWIGDALVGIDPNDYFEVLSSKAAAAVRTVRDRVLRRNAFLAVGYVRVRSRPTEGLLPVVVSISNAMSDDLQWLSKADDSFAVRVFGMPADGLTQCSWVGEPLPRGQISRLRRQMNDFVGREPGTPSGIARLLIDQVYRVAAASSSRVGRNLLVSVLPKSAVPATAYEALGAAPAELSLSRFSKDDLTCMFVPEASEPDRAFFHGPLAVCPGLMTRGAELWTSKPPWWSE